jgi:hypothetical protein
VPLQWSHTGGVELEVLGHHDNGRSRREVDGAIVDLGLQKSLGYPHRQEFLLPQFDGSA